MCLDAILVSRGGGYTHAQKMSFSLLSWHHLDKTPARLLQKTNTIFYHKLKPLYITRCIEMDITHVIVKKYDIQLEDGNTPGLWTLTVASSINLKYFKIFIK